ncbi:MAG: hypothetical protein HC817_02900 [Saprospiraceae bacterium]|nr:hypothetical protein [Saprospiraceae bacterium]
MGFATLTFCRWANYIFASDRAGGLGGIDIWYVQFENGKWSEARNLGAPINTKYDDQTPFIHPDGVTLYFTSEGHAGMGVRSLHDAPQR